MPTPSSIGSSTTRIGSILPATACVGPDQDHSQGIDPQLAYRSKTNRQQDASSGRHHVGTASDMISEWPSDIVGICTGVDYTLRVIFRMWRSPRGFRPHQV